MRDHRPDHADEVTAESADGLVMGLSFGSLLVVVSPRLEYVIDVTCGGRHHCCSGLPIDLSSVLGAGVCFRADNQSGDARVQRQAGLKGEPVKGADLSC